MTADSDGFWSRLCVHPLGAALDLCHSAFTSFNFGLVRRGNDGLKVEAGAILSTLSSQYLVYGMCTNAGEKALAVQKSYVYA